MMVSAVSGRPEIRQLIVFRFSLYDRKAHHSPKPSNGGWRSFPPEFHPNIGHRVMLLQRKIRTRYSRRQIYSKLNTDDYKSLVST